MLEFKKFKYFFIVRNDSFIVFFFNICFFVFNNDIGLEFDFLLGMR